MIRRRWQGIVVHHTAGPDLVTMEMPSIKRWHMEGRRWRDIGYHAVVERVGSDHVVISGRPLYENGAHEPLANRTHLGLAFVGDFSDREPANDALVEGARWAAGMAMICGFEPRDIEPHRNFKATACPGHEFPMSDFRALVALHMGLPAPQQTRGQQHA